jgi:NTE family protein
MNWVLCTHSIEGRDLTDFDVYVGVSSGSLIAAALASGFDTTAMCGMFLYDESVLFPFSPAILMRPAFAEYARRLDLSLKRLERMLQAPGTAG